MNTSKVQKKGASTPKYVSPNQLTICGFETPFAQHLTSENRWVRLSKLIPWDKIVGRYDLQFKSLEGRPPISGRIVIGAVIIKHMLGLSDRETVLQTQENVFLQYFLGYSSFTNEAPFVASLFVEIRERLSLDILSSISDIVVAHCFEKVTEMPAIDLVNDDEGIAADQPSDTGAAGDQIQKEAPLIECSNEKSAVVTNKGKLLMDATVAPQNITYPTDLKLLNAARQKSESLIDKLYDKAIHGDEKVRTYRVIARKDFLNAARKKAKSGKEIYKANGTQIRYLKRNLDHITSLLLAYQQQGVATPLKQKDIDYLYTLELVYHQQHTMHSTNTHQIDNRIVNLHQPHVRPIKRGKEGKKVEFGSKLQVSLVNGFIHLDKLSWDNFNESTSLQASVELYKSKYGYYPAEVLADQIYCTRENRKWLKEKNIKLVAKPLGRPSKEALSNPVSPGERNPIEGKFGQAKVGYGLDNIGAKLKTTSQSWIAAIVLVLNLVRLTRLNLLYLCQYFMTTLSCRLFGRNFWSPSY
jgi:transposase, IS5 family